MTRLPDHLKSALLEDNPRSASPAGVEDAMVSLCITNSVREDLNVLSGLLLTQDGWVLTAAHGLDFKAGSGWVAVASDLTHKSISIDPRFPVITKREDDFALLKFDRSGSAEPMPFAVRRTPMRTGEGVTCLRPRFHLTSDRRVDRARGAVIAEFLAIAAREALDRLLPEYGTARNQIIAANQHAEREYSGGPVVDDSGALVGITSKALKIYGGKLVAITSINKVASVIRDK